MQPAAGGCDASAGRAVAGMLLQRSRQAHAAHPTPRCCALLLTPRCCRLRPLWSPPGQQLQLQAPPFAKPGPEPPPAHLQHAACQLRMCPEPHGDTPAEAHAGGQPLLFPCPAVFIRSVSIHAQEKCARTAFFYCAFSHPQASSQQLDKAGPALS